MSKREEVDWIASELQAFRTSRTDGGFPHSYEDLVLVLVGASESEELSDDDERHICQMAIQRALRAEGPITGSVLRSQLSRARGEILQLPLKPFVLYSSLGLPPHVKLRGARLRGATISFPAAFASSFDRSFIKSIAGSRDLPDDTKILKARVRLSARTSSTAFRDGTSALDFIRGALNLSINMSRGREWNIDETEPVNKVLPGPLHTLHQLSGKPAVEDYWYQPFYRPPAWPYFGQAEILKFEPASLYIRQVCGRSPYREELERALVRYCRALDIRDPQLAFLKLWGLLEVLTASRYDETINRILFLYPEERLNRSVLKVLRDFRNASVHHGSESIARENLFRLHRYVVQVLLFALEPGRKFASLAELGEFLASPKDPKELRRKARLYRDALAFREPSAKQP